MTQHWYDSAADFIEGRIRDRKLRWLIAVPTGLTSILAIVGSALVGLQVLPQIALPVNISLIVLSVFLGVGVLLLALSRRYMRKEIGQKDLILNRYGDRVRAAQEKNVDLFHTTGWVDETAVKKHGDAVIVRTMSIEAGPEPVPAIWALSYRNSSAHLEQRVKEKVRVEARFAPEEDENSGTEIVTAISWEGDRALRVFFFFDRDLAPNSTTRIRLTIKWPKYGADMLDGQVEPNYWTFRRQTTGFNSLVIYESEFAPKGVRITPLDGSPRPDVDRQKASGSTLVRFALADIKVGQEYGYRSELIR